MSRYEQIRDLILGLEGDFDKFYDKENQAAGTRVRQGMQTLKELAQEIRMEVQNIKNTKDAENAKAAEAVKAPEPAAKKGKK